MIIKEQIKAENFTEEEEEYLKMRVLMVGEPSNLKGTLPHVPSLNERKKAEIDAFARRYRPAHSFILVNTITDIC